MRTLAVVVIGGLAQAVSAGGADLTPSQLTQLTVFPASGGERAYSVGVTTCNGVDVAIPWEFATSQHPVFATNLYRLENGLLLQIGQSWAHHPICVLQQAACTPCTPVGGGCANVLGAGCSDASTSAFFAYQPQLGPRSQVNASTGEFPFPFVAPRVDGSLARRCRTPLTEVDPALHAGAIFFFEVVLVNSNDVAAGNSADNIAVRKTSATILFSGGGAPFLGSTAAQTSALDLWATEAEGTLLTTLELAGDGRVLVGSHVTSLGRGLWRYAYSVENQDSHDSLASLSIPLGFGTAIAEPFFHAPLSHSGEITSNEPWTFALDHSSAAWSTESFAANPNANAIRWASTYTFALTSNRPPVNGSATLGLFRSAGTVAATVLAPSLLVGDLDGDGAVGAADLAVLFGSWGSCAACPSDLNGDGAVDAADMAILLGAWTN